MSVVVAPQVDAAASAGDLIKMDGLSSVYYLGADSKRYVFPNEQTYFSWYGDFSGVVTIPQSELESYSLGANVTMRPGTKLVKITTDPKVYAVEPSGTLKWIADEATAISLYGNDWAKRVIDVPDAFFTNYTVNTTSQVSSTAYPAGSLVKFGTAADVYYINADGTASKVANEAAFAANRFKWSDVITSTLALPTLGADITAGTLADTSQGGGGKGIVAGGGTGLTVALASDTPASGTTLSEKGNDGAQALIPVTKVNFTASADGAVKVTTLKFKRAGVPSADGDFAEFYLYDGNTLLAKYNSISDGVLTFTNSAGLFTVAAGTTKGITLKVSLDKDTAASRAYNFGVLAASDITTDGAVVSGSFPMTGSTMSTAEVTDLGKMTVASSGAVSAPDPGTTGHTIWSFTAAAADQKIAIERLKFTIIGTVDATDMTNFKLEVGGTQIGSTVASMATDKTVTFDFATPYEIDKGITRTVNLTADVVGGTNRTFRVYFYNKEDIVAKDLGYNVYVTPNQADTFTKLSVGSDTTISTGSLTVTKATASPSGNVAKDATGVEIAKFDFKAVGEAIKVDSVWLYVNTQTSNNGLYQVKMFVDGTQVGTATNLNENDDTEVSCGNSFIIPAGATKTLVVKADMKDKANGNLTSNETFVFQLGQSGGTGNKSVDYTRQLTGTVDTVGVIAANTLTVKTGALSAAKNGSFGDRSANNPTGTVNATGVKVASFTLTAGAGEAVTVSQIVLQDDATTVMGKNFQNLVLKNGTTQIAAVKTNLNSTTQGTYAFSLTPNVKLTAGQQYVVDVYADVKGSAPDQGTNLNGIKFYSVTATGDTTNADASFNNSGTPIALQVMHVAAAGNLYISKAADRPDAQQLVMGATEQTVAKFKLEASASEDLLITQLTLSDNASAAGDLNNVKITDGTTTWGPVNFGASAATSTYYNATFTGMNLIIPAGGSKTLTVKADVSTSVSGATSGSTHAIAILVDEGAADETIVVKGNQSGQVLTAAADTIDFYGKNETATDVDQVCNTMTVYGTKISVAWAGDTPSGARTGQSAETVAKFNITNTDNAGSFAATIKSINFAMSTTISNTANRELKVYKSSITTSNLVATTSFLAASNLKFSNTNIVNGTNNANSFVSTEIAAGTTQLFIVTLDTTDGAVSGDFSLAINLAEGDIVWSDGTLGAGDVTTVNSLPLESKTLTY